MFWKDACSASSTGLAVRRTKNGNTMLCYPDGTIEVQCSGDPSLNDQEALDDLFDESNHDWLPQLVTQKVIQHPLIGIEWEVQLSFPKLGKRQVSADWIQYIPCSFEFLGERVSLKIDSSLISKYVDLDQGNIEFRSEPVAISDLDQEIKRVEKILANTITQISKDTKQDIGVFLPSTMRWDYFPKVTKHVSISIPNHYDYPDFIFEAIAAKMVNIKEGDYHRCRLHVRVPYTFCDYEELFNKTIDFIKHNTKKQYMDYIKSLYAEDQPIRFVGYVKNKNWVRVRGLI